MLKNVVIILLHAIFACGFVDNANKTAVLLGITNETASCTAVNDKVNKWVRSIVNLSNDLPGVVVIFCCTSVTTYVTGHSGAFDEGNFLELKYNSSSDPNVCNFVEQCLKDNQIENNCNLPRNRCHDSYKLEPINTKLALTMKNVNVATLFTCAPLEHFENISTVVAQIHDFLKFTHDDNESAVINDEYKAHRNRRDNRENKSVDCSRHEICSPCEKKSPHDDNCSTSCRVVIGEENDTDDRCTKLNGTEKIVSCQCPTFEPTFQSWPAVYILAGLGVVTIVMFVASCLMARRRRLQGPRKIRRKKSAKKSAAKKDGDGMNDKKVVKVIKIQKSEPKKSPAITKKSPDQSKVSSSPSPTKKSPAQSATGSSEDGKKR